MVARTRTFVSTRFVGFYCDLGLLNECGVVIMSLGVQESGN